MNEPAYHINLELFEGPLDLLLHLIKKNDLDISDIPVTLILEQYMEYLGLLEELDIDFAGEFILMASELAHIKSRTLLSRDDDGEEEADPRTDLASRLARYQQFKRAAQFLSMRPILNRDVFKRPPAQKEEEAEKEKEIFVEVSPFALLTAFGEILKKAPEKSVHEVEGDRVSVTDRIYQIVELLKNSENISFESLFQNAETKSGLIVTFLAVLEMARLNMVRICQTDPFGMIWVRRVMELSGDIH